MKQVTLEEFGDNPLSFSGDKVLTSSEIRQLISRGLQEGKEVSLVIGGTTMVITWIGEQGWDDTHPCSPRWRIEIE